MFYGQSAVECGLNMNTELTVAWTNAELAGMSLMVLHMVMTTWEQRKWSHVT